MNKRRMYLNFLIVMTIAIQSIGFVSCGGDDDDDRTSNNDTKKVTTLLKGSKWVGQTTDYSVYSYGGATYTQTWTIYFISDSKGVIHWRAVDRDTSLGTSRYEDDIEFTYTVSGNKIYLSGGSDFVFEYYGDYLIEGEDIYKPSALTSSDYSYINKYQNGGSSGGNTNDNGNNNSNKDSYTLCPDSNHPHWIDLGLKSGTKWRCCNEGASKPEDYGGYYKFGQVSSAPSLAQLEELVNNCTYQYTKQNGVNGGKFTGPNGGAIFLPAAGSQWDGRLLFVGYWGYYWSSTPYESRRSYGLYYYVSENAKLSHNWDRYDECSVRPVRK